MDLISRQEAMAFPLSWEHRDKEHGSNEFISGVECYRDYIEELPSAQQEKTSLTVKCEFDDEELSRAIEDVKNAELELIAAQQEQRWIPVEERLPEEPFGCLVTVWDTDPVTMDEFENILPYFVGWDGEQWNDGDGEQCPFEVIAWMPLPPIFREEES